MSFIHSISSFFIESDEENEEPRAGSCKLPESETAGIPGDPTVQANGQELRIVSSAIQDNPPMNSPVPGYSTGTG